MTQSRNALSPVIISAMFLVLLAGCEGSTQNNDAENVTYDGASTTTESIGDAETDIRSDESKREDARSEDDSENEAEDDRPAMPMSSAPMGMMSSPQAAMMQKRHYADGMFAASGDYRSPAGNETVNVSLTLKNGIVTNGSVQGTATHPKSINFQGLFTAGFTQAVVGKPIDSLHLDVVNGSSLTPKGFMDALAKIKAEAAMKA